MEEQQRQTNPEPELGPPPSSDFSWVSLLRRKLTRTNRSEDTHVSIHDTRASLLDLQRRRQRQQQTRQVAVNTALHGQDPLSLAENVKEHVWQLLLHQLRGAEGIRGSVVVETKSDDPQQTLLVKCYGPAVARAGEIRRLLERPNHRIVLQGLVVQVKEEAQPRIDFSLLWGPNPPGDIDSGPDLSVASVPRLTRRSRSADPTQSMGHLGSENTIIADEAPWNARVRRRDRFANTPYWNSTSILVDCLFPSRPKLATNTLCGALVRMMSLEYRGESQLRTWTCGGLIHVDGVPYALTTAHPLILINYGKEQDSDGTTRSSVVDDAFPASDQLSLDGKSNGTSGAQNWWTLGRVYKHAMSNGDHVPANYDWLLVDIAEEHLLPNFTGDPDKNAGPGSVSICTWRGLLQATLLPGTSFIILGQSSFKAMRSSIDQPMSRSALDLLVHVIVELTEYRARRLRLVGLQRRKRARSGDSW
jgi:hypothetical protein